MTMSYEDSAPANIALIKYMGKTSKSNQPANSSLSWTLENLRTFVRITPLPPVEQGGVGGVSGDVSVTQDQWRPLQLSLQQVAEEGNRAELRLSAQGQQRFLKHFDFLKKHWGMQGHFLIESTNNFPADCGLASSASSFAALTQAAAKFFQKTHSQDTNSPGASLDVHQLAELSRHGSGSSCRSFFSPWACWDSQGARAVDLPCEDLLHQVVIVSADKKEVSSSEAHQRVLSSPLFSGRVERAEQRLQHLLQAFKIKNWPLAYQLCWDEFQDMHALFSTSVPAFSYLNSESQKILDWAQNHWREHQDGPLVTMDAGPNVHLLWRTDQEHQARQAQAVLGEHWKVFSSQKARA